jgi:hypothetical protein
MTVFQPDMHAACSAPARPCCAVCGTADVVRDAWAACDTGAQHWTPDAVFDDAFCNRCQTTTPLVWSVPDIEEPQA